MFSLKKLLKLGSVGIVATLSTMGIVFQCSGEIKEKKTDGLESVLTTEQSWTLPELDTASEE